MIGNNHYKSPYSIAMLTYQRVPTFSGKLRRPQEMRTESFWSAAATHTEGFDGRLWWMCMGYVWGLTGKGNATCHMDHARCSKIYILGVYNCAPFPHGCNPDLWASLHTNVPMVVTSINSLMLLWHHLSKSNMATPTSTERTTKHRVYLIHNTLWYCMFPCYLGNPLIYPFSWVTPLVPIGSSKQWIVRRAPVSQIIDRPQIYWSPFITMNQYLPWFTHYWLDYIKNLHS